MRFHPERLRAWFIGLTVDFKVAWYTFLAIAVPALVIVLLETPYPFILGWFKAGSEVSVQVSRVQQGEGEGRLCRDIELGYPKSRLVLFIEKGDDGGKIVIHVFYAANSAR
jgi:hypothetical protein